MMSCRAANISLSYSTIVGTFKRRRLPRVRVDRSNLKVKRVSILPLSICNDDLDHGKLSYEDRLTDAMLTVLHFSRIAAATSFLCCPPALLPSNQNSSVLLLTRVSTLVYPSPSLLTDTRLRIQDVLGALVITRASGIVIRSAGTLFATSSSSSSTAVAAGVASTTSDLAIRYAAMARNIVDNTSAQVGAIDSVVRSLFSFVSIFVQSRYDASSHRYILDDDADILLESLAL